MTESAFIEANKEKWQELEKLLVSKQKDPDRLQELFVEVSSDLSYARTFYTNRSVRLYLNGLTERVLEIIQEKKTRFSWSSIQRFYQHTLPQELWRTRKALLASLVIFSLFVLIGALSTAYNPEFPRVILGDRYVEMTQENINNGDPMAVYKDMEQNEMFWYITLNNIRVAFVAFIFGLLGSIGTVFILLQNGIMLGAFQYFFYQKGLFLTSFLTIWIHGTIEISAIVIAGAAGLILGDGILNPGTYSRSQSLQLASRRSLKILLSTVPLFILAGFLESFITRLTDLPSLVKVGIILASLFLIIYHYVITPYKWSKKNTLWEDDNQLFLSGISPDDLNVKMYRSFNSISETSLSFVRLYIGQFFKYAVAPVMVICFITFWLWAKYGEITQDLLVIDEFLYYDFSLFSFKTGGWTLLILYLVCIIHVNCVASLIFHKRSVNYSFYLQNLKKTILPGTIVSLPFLAIFYFLTVNNFLLFLLFIPIQLVAISLFNAAEEHQNFISTIKKSISDSYQFYINFLPFHLILFFLAFLVNILVSTELGSYYIHLISTMQLFPGALNNVVLVRMIISLLFFSVLYFLAYAIYAYQYNSSLSKTESTDLLLRVENFGEKVKLKRS